MVPFASIQQIAKMTFIPATASSLGQIASLHLEAMSFGSPSTLGSSETGSGHHVRGVPEAA
jgi:hypothetical protein